MHHRMHFLAFSLLLFQSIFVRIGFSLDVYDRFANCNTSTLFTCGSLQVNLTYPFRMDGRPDYCGYPGFNLNCINGNSTVIYINQKQYQVRTIDDTNQVMTIVDIDFVNSDCPTPYKNTTINLNLYDYTDRDRNLTLYYNCTSVISLPLLYEIGCVTGVAGQRSYYRLNGGDSTYSDLLGTCPSTALVPLHQTAADALMNSTVSFGDALKEGFDVRWTPGNGWCTSCLSSGGVCGYNDTSPSDQTCYCSTGSQLGSCSSEGNSSHMDKKIIIGVCAAIFGFMIACGGFYCWYRRRKNKGKLDSSAILFRSASSKPSYKTDPELGSTHYTELGSSHFQTHIFTYKELQEATEGFASSKELGDGGFGAVYQGKLQDGRIVAVKRLYENNYKRVEQFMNEVEILTRLRHQNLVTLYGCTSHHSRELLLVYELVPNGTVADHLHGPRASEGALTWPIRMNIAMETADALAYLHAFEPQIIHRDIKTNNILLDNNFCVKVADFGLSRLFPMDATHVSTAPQGTPGYLDPEYHQLYQLTDKSDVYSFGVVLVELLSSKPAVDITRHRHEINLASLAIKKIQSGLLHELVDPGLGFESDAGVRRKVTLVAEVAFRCLQAEKEMRPTMEEVLDALKGIEDESYNAEKPQVDVPVRDDTTLLKNSMPFSPDTVTDKWASRSTTPNTSG